MNIPHNRPTLDIEEKKAAQRVLDSGWLAQGKEVEVFENAFCEFLGLPEGHAVAVSSGTAALYLALWALDLQNKKIALPVYVCSALRNAIDLLGGVSCFVDVSKDSPNISISEIQQQKVDAAIIPHMFGFPVDFSSLKNMLIVEDCAQAIGAAIRGIPVGLHGDVGIFSFYATKLMTSGGQGGMVVSKNKSLVDKVRDYREFDCRHDQRSRFNFQMTDLQAAIGREQLKKLPAFLEKRHFLFEHYKTSGMPFMDIANADRTILKPQYYRAVLRVSSPQTVIEKLASKGVRAIIPIEGWELLARKENAYDLSQSTVSLPLYPTLTEKEIGYILSEI